MDKETILNELLQQYRKTRPGSKALFEKARHHQIDGGSHNLRLFSPFPFYDKSCSGSTVTDVDGHSYVDFWQGHFANILGHNPSCVREDLLEMFDQGQGLATGFPGLLQQELASLILSRIGQERIRFTTSGALATMYAVMLARTHTDRDVVLKVGGGWHGSQPFLLKGVSSYEQGLNKPESAGLPPGILSQTVTTRFNDVSDLEETFNTYGSQAACLIVEPFIGAGGFISARPEYLQEVRDLCSHHQVLLIIDEVIFSGRLLPVYGRTRSDHGLSVQFRELVHDPQVAHQDPAPDQFGQPGQTVRHFRV